MFDRFVHLYTFYLSKYVLSTVLYYIVIMFFLTNKLNYLTNIWIQSISHELIRPELHYCARYRAKSAPFCVACASSGLHRPDPAQPF